LADKSSAQQTADKLGAAQTANAAAAAGPERATVTEPAQAAAATADRSGNVVYVGCKLPNGVVLDLDRYVPINDRGDIRLEKSKLPPVTLKGWAFRVGIDAPLVSPGGYVFTPVPREFWAEWIKRNGEGDLIASQMIIFGDTMDAAQGKAVDRAELVRVFRGAIPRKEDGVETAKDDRGNPVLASAGALI
jgi:hypothetical protein